MAMFRQYDGNHSESYVPRDLLKKVHWDVKIRPETVEQGISDVGRSLCGRSGLVYVSRQRQDVTCKRCLSALEERNHED